MKRLTLAISLSLLLMVLMGACGRGGKVKVTEEEAEILFDTLNHDFGLVPKDSSVSWDFVFSNIGATPLRLRNVVPSCGCTLVNYPEDDIEPGEQASISVVYDSHNRRPGHFSKSIRVFSNAKTSFLRLYITGDVEE